MVYLHDLFVLIEVVTGAGGSAKFFIFRNYLTKGLCSLKALEDVSQLSSVFYVLCSDTIELPLTHSKSLHSYPSKSEAN